MSDSPLHDAIARQYSQWVYPAPVEDLSTLAAERRDGFDPSLHHLLYWPDRDYPESLDILVAGCGSVQAAEIAFHNRRARVVGIDVSDTSLESTRRLKTKHDLSNLELKQLPIEDAARLGRDFDLILATGVIHHLEDPLAGMKALGGRLHPDGVIAAYLYGRRGRIGIDLLHAMFARAGLRQDAASLAVVKATLTALPDNHPLRAAMAHLGDTHFDAGLVDLFLNARQRSYAAEECVALVEAAGLAFQGWKENAYYHPEAYLAPEHPLYTRIAGLPASKMYEAMDLFACHAGHAFLACRADRPKSHYVIDLSGAQALAYVPFLRHGAQLLPADPAGGAPARAKRGPLEYPLAVAPARMLEIIDGRRSIAAILDAASAAGLGDRTRVEPHGRALFRLLWRLGVAAFRLPG